MKNHISALFNLSGKRIAITGGTGVLGSEIACGLSELGARIAILDLNTELHEESKKRLDASGSEYTVIKCNVLHSESIQNALEETLKKFGGVDILINGAGGNHPGATTSDNLPFFDISTDSFNWVLQLNLNGTVLPSQIFSRFFAGKKEGNILNVSSMNAFRPLTRIPAYSAAKAAVSNFTQWLAVHLAHEYSPEIRVNAIAPGFFMTAQNRFLLTDEKTGELTERGRLIMSHTPMNRFGKPEDLIGAVAWLISPASSFVTGVVLPVDGGFSAFSGV